MIKSVSERAWERCSLLTHSAVRFSQHFGSAAIAVFPSLHRGCTAASQLINAALLLFFPKLLAQPATALSSPPGITMLFHCRLFVSQGARPALPTPCCPRTDTQTSDCSIPLTTTTRAVPTSESPWCHTACTSLATLNTSVPIFTHLTDNISADFSVPVRNGYTGKWQTTGKCRRNKTVPFERYPELLPKKKLLQPSDGDVSKSRRKKIRVR